ncbi:14921_t:CDS:2 [Gigaspora margarita]|uniref:14921_t:CDS:1 n=1 Tax=Gigaspora margarita TaxID=4874 RepID=A0ABM8W795_GIGMA|nr:14921_t:CDS:2 [Gigaspora margarita]
MGTCNSKSIKKANPINSPCSPKEIEFRYIDGRRFHNLENVVYPLPNDDDETDRLHFRHFLTRYIWQSNFSAPINDILTDSETQILDVGCGAASWAFDMATTYPLIQIIGIDISQQPPTYIKPDNFTFVKANVLEEIPFEENTFDYVFQRNLFGAFTEQNWPDVIDELVRVLKPGGFIELSEPSMLHNAGPATKRLCEAGQLRNIKKEIRKCRHGAKSNQAELNLSKTAINNLVNTYSAWKPRLAKIMKISSEEYDELAKISEKELFEYDTYYNIVRVYARKSL